MNCDDFLTRMHECIDDRVPFDSDHLLREHVEQCPSCRGQWNAWLQISSILPSQELDQDEQVVRARFFSAGAVRFGLGVSVAAAILMMVSVIPTEETEPSRAEIASSSAMTSAAPTESAMDAVKWWQDVQQRDWMAQTMPTVRSVGEGVAPLGRSLLQAVSILTVSSGEQPS